ncbi:hypothetical protein GO755_39095 [Spirosoma sp. HMF4905]|uniref:Uncharacterized protein n=1 Tax=Spirosoma arboris TaxID=2682092 RepID=A0A7K1SR62_9BACT|nr:hypothetical protein [Spirosoma arboris]MVM36086.1 hypothetical protein [Spirosoma arboris]
MTSIVLNVKDDMSLKLKQQLLRLHQEHFTKLSRMYNTLSENDREGQFGKELYAEMKSLNEKILSN